MNFKDYKRFLKSDKLKLILLIILAIFIFIGAIMASVILSILKETPKTELKNLSQTFNQTSSIYDEDGKLLEKIESLEYRTIVPLDRMPKDLQNAFIAIEDHKFYSHHGLYPRGIAAAMIANIKAGSFVRGGSTITQQLVKNVYLSNVKSISRKVQEAYLALRIEKELTKDEILEAYLNRIYLGQGTYGVQAAASTYFSKDVKDLNTAECALLAGIVKSPVEFPPFKTIPAKYLNKNLNVITSRNINNEDMYLVLNEKAFDRQKVVLARMHKLGLIDDRDYESAKNFDIRSDIKPGIKIHHNMSSYSMDCIKNDAIDYLSEINSITKEEAEHKLFTGGYKIYTSIDENLQRDMEEKFLNFTDEIKKSSASKGAKMLDYELCDGNICHEGEIFYYRRDQYFDENFNFKIPKEFYSISKRGDLKIDSRFFTKNPQKLEFIDLYELSDEDVLLTYNMGQLNIDSAYYELKPDYVIIDGGYLREKENFYKIDETENLIIENENFEHDDRPTTQPQLAGIISDSNGFIKAIVGGLDIENKNAKILNRAIDSRRAPGTLIRPFTVFIPALQSGYTLGSVFDDVPIEIDKIMWPTNSYNSFKGLMTLRQAYQCDSNVIAASIVKELGKDKSMDMLKKYSIISKDPDKDSFITYKENEKRHDENLDALALGNMQVGISLKEALNMYSSIADDGVLRENTSIIKIVDRNNKTILDNSSRGNSVIDDKVSYLMLDMLREKNNLPKSIRIGGEKACANFGENRFGSDQYVVGFDGGHKAIIWMGADSPKIKLNTGKLTLIDQFNKMTENLEPKPTREDPDYIVKKYICSKSSKLGTKLTELAKAGYTEKFIKGTEPTEYDNMFKKYLICSDSNQLATQYCPSDSVEYKVMFERNPRYDPAKHFGIYPEDYQYIPKSYCKIHTKSWYEENKEEDEEKNSEKDDSKTPVKDRKSSGQTQDKKSGEKKKDKDKPDKERKDNVSRRKNKSKK